ncbi:ISCU enzyme, partial [Nesospiza acunhae]|nr:ISCU enzyme [Nesospiza acunhae]
VTLADAVSWQVVDHYENPRNVGSLDRNAKNVGTGLVGAPACGDVMKLQVTLGTRWHLGGVDEALKIKNTDIAKELCLPPVKLHCSMLAEDAIKAALADYKLKQDPNRESDKKA